ncbi:MAG TPA: SIS domain-containing protein [Terriglobales bacterium]|nr:SIS domain-containing protein [Terriglobales bacterium]
MDGAQPNSSGLGTHTLAEILSQPNCWSECLKRLESTDTIREIGKRFGNSPEWVFVGCGSSYYIAQAAAASWIAITGTRARAIPASEILLFPEMIFNGMKEFVPVLISRSGQTSEVLRVAQFLNERKIPSLAVSCATREKLEKLASAAILLPEADEQSTVMTRSFTSMLLALQYLAATLAGKTSILQTFRSLPAVAEKVLPDLPNRVHEFVNRNSFSDYVCLGQGPYYGLACESALKVMEMSRTYAQSFHTLEFRHGPKSVVSGDVLLTFLLSESNHGAEVEVVEEIKELGGKTLVVANHISRRARAAADLAIDLDCDLPEFPSIAPFVFAGQLVGFYAATQKGLDPDRPVNLSRVVLLAD